MNYINYPFDLLIAINILRIVHILQFSAEHCQPKILLFNYGCLLAEPIAKTEETKGFSKLFCFLKKVESNSTI